MGIEIVSVVVQIIPAGKNLPTGYKYENTSAVAWWWNNVTSLQIYITKTRWFKLTFNFLGFIVINPLFLTSISMDSISTPNMQDPLTVLIEGLLYTFWVRGKCFLYISYILFMKKKKNDKNMTHSKNKFYICL